MKIRVTFKTPNATYDAVQEAIIAKCGDRRSASDEAESESIRDRQIEEEEKAAPLLSKYIKWGEYVVIDFDTEEGTAVVVPVN